jgi:THO complex subunit 2
VPQHYINLVLSPEFLPPAMHPWGGDSRGLNRAFLKLSTSAFYKQHNSNLLREASEGFSALIVLLTGPLVFTDNKDETDAERSVRAADVWARIETIIGTYNLAPIRVLDLIIEVASLHVAVQWRFFLDLISASYWGRHRAPSAATFNGVGADEAEHIARSMDLSPEDDCTIAKALGFWFRYYQDASTLPNGKMPIGFVTFAALLVKEGYVKPALLLPNLSPDEDGMAEIESRYKAAMTSQSGPNNALMNTVLDDDEAPGGGSAALQEEEKPKKQSEQKISLLHALLAIGEVEFSLTLLAQHPWILQAYPEIAQLVLRNIDHAIDPVFRSFTNLPAYTPTPARTFEHVVPTLTCPPPPFTATTKFEFFQPGWSTFVEQWNSIDDVFIKGEHWLRLLAGLGGRAAGTMTKICRIMKVYFDGLRQQKLAQLGYDEATLTRQQALELRATPSEIAPWSTVIRGTLLPALTVADHATASFDHELEQVIADLPWETLAAFVGEWRDQTCNAKTRGYMAPAAHATTKATREIKQALSRVTAAAAQPNPAAPTATSQAAERIPARALAKHGRGNPAALWTVSNSQVMAYGSVGNIGEHIIEVGRYTNHLSKEVAVFTWVDALANTKTSLTAIDRRSSYADLT